MVNDGEVQDLTRRVVEGSIEEEALEKMVRKEEQASVRNARSVSSHQEGICVRPLFTKHSPDGNKHQKAPGVQAQSGRMHLRGEGLVDQNQSTINKASEELRLRQLREDLETDMKNPNKASKPEVKGISRCSNFPQVGGMQFAKGPRPTEDEHGSNVRGAFSEGEARLAKFPPAASVRPSPPVTIVDLPVMLSRRY